MTKKQPSTATWFHQVLDLAMDEESDGDWRAVMKNMARRIEDEHGERIALAPGRPMRELDAEERGLLDEAATLMRQGDTPEDAARAVARRYTGPLAPSDFAELIVRRLKA